MKLKLRHYFGILLNALFLFLLSGGITYAAVTLSQDIKVGGGTQDVTLNGDDVYITGTFEVDGTARLDGVLTVNASSTFAHGGATSWLYITTGNLKVGNGAQKIVLDGEDAYIEGTLETGGNFNVNGFATTTAASGNLALGGLLTLNNDSTGDPYFILQDAGTSKWFLGFDNSDSDKFRITPLAGSFTATSSGLTINPGGFVGIGTTNPAAALDISGVLTTNSSSTFGMGNASDWLYITTGNLKVGNGTNRIVLDGEDAYIEGTLETGGNFNVNGFATTTAASGNLALGGLLTLNNDSTGDPYFILQDAGTSKWFLGFDNSDSDKFRLTPLAGTFTATSSGITVNLGGLVGIGTTDPSATLEIGDGTDSIEFSTVGDITFVDANGAASITGSAGGALTVAAGASQALTLTGNLASTWSTSAGNLTITAGGTGHLLLTTDSDTFVGIGTVLPSHRLTVSGTDSASTTLTINNQNSGDSMIALQTATTTQWFIGVDDSDSDKFRITQALAFTATSSGITIGTASRVGIGTTNPTTVLQVDGSVTIDLEGSTSTAHGVCHTGNHTGTDDVTLVDCNSTPIADYAEMYPTEGTLSIGDLVTVSAKYATTKDGDRMVKLTKTTQPYQSPIIGVVSEATGDFNVIGYNINDSDNPLAIALMGRVKVKVSLENGYIRAGDLLTSSSKSGVAMRASKGGPTVGIALNSYDGTQKSNKILVFINLKQ